MHQVEQLPALLAQIESAADSEQRAAPVSAPHSALPSKTVELHTVTNQRAALSAARARPPHVVLLEVNRRSNSRARFGAMLRYRFPAATLLAVSAHEPAGVFNFDGWLQVPLVKRQVTRVFRALLDSVNSHRLEIGPLQLDLAKRTIVTPHGSHALTPKQCALLHMLIERHNCDVTRGEIMQAIWNTSYLDDTRTLDVHIRWLRERIEPNPSNPVYLTTVRGVGYRLSLDGAQ